MKRIVAGLLALASLTAARAASTKPRTPVVTIHATVKAIIDARDLTITAPGEPTVAVAMTARGTIQHAGQNVAITAFTPGTAITLHGHWLNPTTFSASKAYDLETEQLATAARKPPLFHVQSLSANMISLISSTGVTVTAPVARTRVGRGQLGALTAMQNVANVEARVSNGPDAQPCLSLTIPKR